MAPEGWERLRSVFAEATDLGPPERAQFLDTVFAPGSPERAEVDRLLAAHDNPHEVPDTVGPIPWKFGDSEPELKPGALISGRFRVVRSIGRGGMGDVYEAEDLDLGGRVALKTVRSDWQGEGAFLSRFKREIQIARRLTHPNLCRVFDGGRHTSAEGEETVYLTMELLEGETLAARLEREGSLPIEQASTILAQALAGLSALHDAGVIHRDLKPGNVMLCHAAKGAERAVLMDFGLARNLSEAGPSGAQTRSSVIVGTPDYMAPEQMLGKPAGPATDLFSLGVLLHHMLTGGKPWPEEDRWTAPPLPLRRIRPDAPKEWEEAIERCLHRDPAERPATVWELARLLGVTPEGASSAERSALQRRRRTAPLQWITAASLAVVALSVWALRDIRQGSEPTPAAGPQAELRVVLLPFEAIGDGDALGGAAAGLGDVIARRLSQFAGPAGKVSITSPREVRGRGIESPSQAFEQLGAEMAVEGSLSANGDEVQLTLAVVNPETAAVLDSATVTDRRDNLLGLERKAVSRLSRMLSMRLRPENAEAPLDLAPGAYEFYVQGRGYLERDDQLEQVELAEGLFRKALQIEPELADAQAGLAAALWQKFKRTSDPDWIAEAVQEAEKALTLDPDLAEAHVTLGLAKNRRPETQEEALSHFERVLASDPNDGEALEGLADTYRRMGRKEEAEAAYRDMLARRRGDWRAYKQMALFYEGQGRYEEAASLLKQALELTPDNAEIQGTLGTVYMLNGNFEEARAAYERSIAIEPTKAALANLGGLYQRDGKHEKAIDVLKKATEMEGADYQVWNALAYAYSRAGNTSDRDHAAARAIDLASRTATIDPRNAGALLSMASSKALIGDFRGAVDLAERAVWIQPESPRTLAAAATLLADIGHTSRARDLACRSRNLGLSTAVLEVVPSLQRALDTLGPCQQLTGAPQE